MTADPTPAEQATPRALYLDATAAADSLACAAAGGLDVGQRWKAAIASLCELAVTCDMLGRHENGHEARALRYRIVMRPEDPGGYRKAEAWCRELAGPPPARTTEPPPCVPVARRCPVCGVVWTQSQTVCDGERCLADAAEHESAAQGGAAILRREHRLRLVDREGVCERCGVRARYRAGTAWVEYHYADVWTTMAPPCKEALARDVEPLHLDDGGILCVPCPTSGGISTDDRAAFDAAPNRCPACAIVLDGRETKGEP